MDGIAWTFFVFLVGVAVVYFFGNKAETRYYGANATLLVASPEWGAR